MPTWPGDIGDIAHPGEGRGRRRARRAALALVAVAALGAAPACVVGPKDDGVPVSVRCPATCGGPLLDALSAALGRPVADRGGRVALSLTPADLAPLRRVAQNPVDKLRRLDADLDLRDGGARGRVDARFAVRDVAQSVASGLRLGLRFFAPASVRAGVAATADGEHLRLDLDLDRDGVTWLLAAISPYLRR
ncbi:MAG: hypothetical protein H6745_18095 [Deltaproteobacteria bacterium]|nr:hypothetical protein [Deltaproteobacteria bacterium]